MEDNTEPVQERSFQGRPRAFGLLAAVQMTLILAINVVAIRLPAIQRDLDLSPGRLALVSSGYGLAFSALLLLGARLADLFRPRRMLGIIVNVASTIGAHLALPTMGAYAATKAAVSTLTRVAAKENIANGIRINAISPDPVDTPVSRFPGETHGDRDARIAGVLPIGRVATPAKSPPRSSGWRHPSRASPSATTSSSTVPASPDRIPLQTTPAGLPVLGAGSTGRGVKARTLQVHLRPAAPACGAKANSDAHLANRWSAP